MKLATLGDLTQSVSKCDPRREYDEVFTYIDLGSVDNVKKCISAPSLVAGSEAPSRARQVVRKQDVLVATVRPNLNAVALVSSEFDGAIASTGFTVLRPGENLHPAYLYHWVKSPIFMHEMVRRATGASYPAVSDRIVKQSKIPLVSMGEQRRIAGILDQADAIRTKRRASLDLLDELVQSVFVDFSVPSTLKQVRFGDLVQNFRNGLSPSSSGGFGAQVLTLGAITHGRFDPTSRRAAVFDRLPEEGVRVRKHDFLVCRGNGNINLVGQGVFPRSDEEQVVFPDTMIACRLNADKICPPYLAALWGQRVVRQQIEAGARTTNGTFKVNQKILGDVSLSVPPLDVQQEFASRVEQINAQRALVERALKKDEELFASLQSRAFKGEL